MATKKHKASTGTKVGIGIGITAAALAAAGGYFLYGSRSAAKHRRQVKSWMLRAKAEVLEGLEHASEMTQEDYEKLVERASKGYAKLKSVSGPEMAAFKKEMAEHWKDIEKSAGKQVKKAAKVATKTAKKVAKHTAKKTAKKS